MEGLPGRKKLQLMALSNDDQARIREYLLGHLSDEEQEKLEERLMSEDDLFEELEISKGELIEDYRSGELAEKDHSWFERHYLASLEGRQRYTFAAALDCLEPPAPVPKPLGFFERLASFFKMPQRALATTAAAVLAVVVIGVLIFPTGPQTSYAISLTNTALTRGTDENALPVKVRLPANTSEVRASLQLPKAFPPQTRFQALLDDRTEKTPVNVAGYNDNVVTVTIPVRELPRGEYSLELTAFLDGTEEAIPGDYRFVVE
jgi:hypothetical protein